MLQLMGLQRVGHNWETELNSEAEGEHKESVPQPIFPESTSGGS